MWSYLEMKAERLGGMFYFYESIIGGQPLIIWGGVVKIFMDLFFSQRASSYNFSLRDLRNQFFWDFRHAPQMINGRPLADFTVIAICSTNAVQNTQEPIF